MDKRMETAVSADRSYAFNKTRQASLADVGPAILSLCEKRR